MSLFGDICSITLLNQCEMAKGAGPGYRQYGLLFRRSISSTTLLELYFQTLIILSEKNPASMHASSLLRT
jgi:hypothetical protein